MHEPINVKSPNNISEWQMGFNSAFKGLMRLCVQFMDPSTDYLLPEHKSEGPLSRGQ
jgi:hypothetical protein